MAEVAGEMMLGKPQLLGTVFLEDKAQSEPEKSGSSNCAHGLWSQAPGEGHLRILGFALSVASPVPVHPELQPLCVNSRLRTSWA